MATRQRTSTVQGQPSLHPSYEDFQPKTDMEETQEAYFILIELPGFARADQIRISFVNYTRMLSVSGERPIGGNRWSRFNQAYPVPQNCEVEKIQARFNQGVLTIAMPKKLVSQVAPKKEEKATQEQGPFPSKKAAAEEPRPEKPQEDIIPPKSTTSRVEEPRDKKNASLPIPPQRPIESQKPADEKPQKGPFEIEQKPTLTTAPRKPIDEKPQMGQEEIRQKTTLSTIPRKQRDEKAVGTRAEDAEKEKEMKKEVKEADHGKPSSESRKPQKAVEKGMFKEKEIRTRKEPNTPEKEKETTTEDGKEDMIDTIGKGIKQVSASASEVVTRIAERKWNDEDKPTLVNIGAAVLVIAALGAYLSYRFASSGRT